MSLGRYSLAQKDAVNWLAEINDESVDLIITDPPYESLEKHRRVGTTTRLKKSKASSNEWFRIFPNQRFEELFHQVYRVLRKNSHFYLFCDAETMFVAKPAAEAVGFRFWKPIIWDKVKIGMGYHYRARCERILFFEKGKRRLNDLGVPDVLAVPRIHRGYPTEKPVELMRILVEQSTSPGALVLDPFMGSGSVGVAAVESGRDFAGNDLATSSLELSQQRLSNAGAQRHQIFLPSKPSSPTFSGLLFENSGVDSMAISPAHRGRLQAQGDDLQGDPSEPWAQLNPPPKSDGTTKLERLEAGLHGRARTLRAVAFKKAQRYITTCPSDGLPSPLSKSFDVESPPKKARRARVDIEVRRGKAFVDDL